MDTATGAAQDGPPHTLDAAATPDRRPHYVGAAVVLAVGGFALVESLDLGYWLKGPGPGFFPFWMGVLLVTMSVVWAVQTATGRTGRTARPPAPPGGRRNAALLAVALAVAILLLDLVGYQLSMFLLALFHLVVIGRRRWLESAAFAAVAGFGVYALFAYLLQVYLPVATLEPFRSWGL